MRIQWGPTPGQVQVHLLDEPNAFAQEDACIAAAHAVARQVYAADIVLPISILKILWLAFDDDNNVLGYIYGLPLVPEAFKRIFNADWNEKHIKASEIRQYTTVCDQSVVVSHTWQPGAYHWYLCSLVVRPDVQRTQVGKSLRKRVLQDLASLADRQIIVSELSAETVSEGGVRCMPSLGMKFHHATESKSYVFHTNTSPSELLQLAAKL